MLANALGDREEASGLPHVSAVINWFGISDLAAVFPVIGGNYNYLAAWLGDEGRLSAIARD